MTSFIAFLWTTFRLATPLSFAALGGYCSERSGTINLALEGMLLIGAFCAAVFAHITHNAFWGVIGAVGGALIFAAIHGFLCIELKSNQIISGISLNLLALGLPPVLSKSLFNITSGTPLLTSSERIQAWGGVSPFVVGSVFIMLLLWFVHHHTKLGQYFRFAGEHSQALLSQGISVKKIRWIGILLSGVLCGLGGAYLAIDHGSGFSRNMTAGRGYIALAALIVGRWHPFKTFIAALVFGAVEASQILLQGVYFSTEFIVPVQWIQILPYLITVLVLAFTSGGRHQKFYSPKELGIPLT